jgi:tetratricopeptide (TPR) repeat protein
MSWYNKPIDYILFKIFELIYGRDWRQIFMHEEWRKINQLLSQGKIDRAIIMAKQLLNVARSIFPSPNNYLASTLNNLGMIYANQGRCLEAELLYIEALDILNQLFGQTANQDFAAIANNLASLYASQGKWKEAEPLHLKSLNILRELCGEEKTENLASSMTNLAALYTYQGRWSEAEPLYLEALPILRHLFGDKLTTCVNNLEQTTQYQRLIHGINVLATCVNNLGLLYTNQGRWTEAKPLQLEALDIRRQLYGGTANKDLAASITNVAYLYSSQGRWEKAEPLLVESVNILYQLFGEKVNNDIATSLNNLAEFYTYQERWKEAESIQIKALQIRRQLFGETANNDLATSLNNLAQSYLAQRKWDEAEPLYWQALQIRRQLFGATANKDLAASLNNLAQFYSEQEKWQEAEPLQLETLDISRQLYGKTANKDLATGLNNLALLYSDQKKWQEAEPLYIETIDILYQLFGERGHPDLVTSYQNYAFNLVQQTRYRDAIEYYAAAAKVDIKVLADRFQGQTEVERLSYRDRRQSRIDVLLSCLWHYLAEDSAAIAQAFEVIYLWKSIATAVEIALSAAISRSDDAELQQTAAERQKLRRQLNQITQKPPTENIAAYQQEVNRLQIELNQLEKEIAAKVPRAELMETMIDRQAINQLVPADNILVDFVRFELHDIVNETKGESHYLAFVLTDAGLDGIKLIKLGTAAEIDESIRQFRQVASDLNVKKMNPFEEDEPVRDPNILLAPYQTYAIDLRQTIFDPLNLPTHSTEVIFAPDGDLNLVPFGILPLENGILSDRLSIRYVSASRDLRPRLQPPAPASMGTIAANPNYDFPADEIAPPPTANIQKSGSISTLNYKLTPLPQTESLAQKIAQSLRIKPHLGNDAQAINLRQLRSPQYLVIATHGLHGLDPEGGDNPDPMRDAGLALAGFNTSRAGGELPPELEGGLFTARDLLELDLWGTQIAILLACSSGTGNVRQGEGVFGLKRALAIAGVAELIVSLWDVPVQTSILLMDKFFEYYRGGAVQPAVICLQQAQSYIRNITRAELLSIEQGRIILQEIDAKIDHLQGAEHPLQHPMFWGAWLCQG